MLDDGVIGTLQDKPPTRSAFLGRAFNEDIARDSLAFGGVLAFLTVALAVGARLSLPFTGQSHTFLFLLGAIMISAWYGGLWSGLFATLLSVLSVAYFFMSPVHSFILGAQDFFPTLVFCVEGVLMSLFCQGRHRAGNALRESEKVNRAILDSLTAHIAVLDRDGNIVSVNQAWQRFGRDNSPASGHADLPCLFPGGNYLEACRNAPDDPDAQAAFKGIRAVLDGHQPQFMMEYPCHSPTESRWFLLFVTPLARYQYSGGGAVVSHFDISERRKAEMERAQFLELEQQARETAEAANRSKDEFLAIVSHELRTPLHSILGWVQILGGDDLDDATRAQALQTIERNVRTQSHLVNDLLDVSRIVTGKLSLTRAPLELQAVLCTAMQMMESQVRQKSISLSTDFQASPRVSGDSQRLQQAIWNLIQNAIKFSSEGSQVCVRLEEKLGKARLSVIDNGKGIEAEFLPSIFDRFRQADGTTTRRHGGLGLGLAITRHVIELHEGTIEAFSDGSGKGAQFVIELPLLDEAPPY